MNCNSNENVCSVKKENNTGYYRLHTIWNTDGFFINITSKNGAWRGEMSPRDVEKMSSQLDLTPDTYMKQCKEALTCHDGFPGMSYAVDNGSFTWKKIVDEDSGIKIKMGSVMLQPANFVDTIQDLVTAALNCNKELQKQFTHLSRENDKNLANRNELLNKLNDLIKTKDAMETDLYSKFILLINSKKKRIKQLESHVTTTQNFNVDPKETAKTDAPSSDPYNIETESDASDQSEPLVKKSKKSSKNKEVIPNSSLTSGESPTFEDGHPASSTLSNDSIDKFPSTKDELLDYFYGSG